MLPPQGLCTHFSVCFEGLPLSLMAQKSHLTKVFPKRSKLSTSTPIWHSLLISLNSFFQETNYHLQCYTIYLLNMYFTLSTHTDTHWNENKENKRTFVCLAHHFFSAALTDTSGYFLSEEMTFRRASIHLSHALHSFLHRRKNTYLFRIIWKKKSCFLLLIPLPGKRRET